MAVRRTIRPDQLAAAVEIRSDLEGWDAANGALRSVARAFPDNDYESALVKTSVLNQLYSTRVMAVFRMGRHIESLANNGVFEKSDSVGIVEDIATLDGENAKRRHWAFASKFGHFFLGGDRFPIYDRFAADVLLFHTGERLNIAGCRNPYREFYDRFQEVREVSGLSGESCSDLDSYLWFAGCYRAWLKKGAKAPINREVREYLSGTKRDGESKKETLIRRLVPDEYFSDFSKTRKHA